MVSMLSRRSGSWPGGDPQPRHPHLVGRRPPARRLHVQIKKLDDANLLYQVVGQFADVDLHPDTDFPDPTSPTSLPAGPVTELNQVQVKDGAGRVNLKSPTHVGKGLLSPFFQTPFWLAPWRCGCGCQSR